MKIQTIYAVALTSMLLTSGSTPSASPASAQNSFMNRFFSSVRSDFDDWPFTTKTNPSNYPTMNVTETDDAYVLEFEVPGYNKRTLALNLDGRRLTLSGKREAPSIKAKTKASLHEEFLYGEFSRTLILPNNIKSNKPKAELKDGMLTVTLYKETKKAPSSNTSIEIN